MEALNLQKARTGDRYAGSGSGQGRFDGCLEVGDVPRMSAKSTKGALRIFLARGEGDVRE